MVVCKKIGRTETQSSRANVEKFKSFAIISLPWFDFVDAVAVMSEDCSPRAGRNYYGWYVHVAFLCILVIDTIVGISHRLAHLTSKRMTMHLHRFVGMVLETNTQSIIAAIKDMQKLEEFSDKKVAADKASRQADSGRKF